MAATGPLKKSHPTLKKEWLKLILKKSQFG